MHIRPTIPTVAALQRAAIARRAAADEAIRQAHDAADKLAALLDRHYSDAGDDAALIEAWTDQIQHIAEEIRAVLGEPRVMRHGVLVPAGMVAR